MASYYVDTAADTGGDGTTPELTGVHCAFKTLAQVNAATFVAGDVINLRRGCLWRETLTIGETGSSGSPITYTAYGTGGQPKISGANLVSTWTNMSGNIWQASCSTQPHIVFMNSAPGTEMGRRYASWTNHSGNIWQTACAEEPSLVTFNTTLGTKEVSHDSCDAPNEWAWETGTLYIYAASDPNTLYGAGPGVRAGAVNALGEWVWGGNGILYIYATSDPDTLYTSPGVEAGVRDDCISTGYTAGRNYIVLDDIAAYGSNLGAIVFAYRATNWTVDGCTFQYPGRTGMLLRGVSYWTITGCTITGWRATPTAVWRGVYFYADAPGNQSHNNTVTLSTIQYWCGNGVHFQGTNSTYRTYGNSCTRNDLSHNASGFRLSFCDSTEIAYNTCDDCRPGGYAAAESYSGAARTSSNNDVHHNTFSNSTQGFEFWAYDGSSPYTDDGPSNNNKFHHNKVYGMDNYGFQVYEGCCNYTEVYDNIIYDNNDAGIHITENTGAGIGNVVYHNTLYGNDTDNAGYADVYWGSDCAGWTFKNNVMLNTNRFCLHTHQAASFTHGTNCYYRASGSVVDINGTGYTIATITDWEATGRGADPKFVSITPGSEDFHLQSDSPCIDAAEDVGIDTDFYDNGRV